MSKRSTDGPSNPQHVFHASGRTAAVPLVPARAGLSGSNDLPFAEDFLAEISALDERRDRGRQKLQEAGLIKLPRQDPGRVAKGDARDAYECYG